jgi:hypothetical protein
VKRFLLLLALAVFPSSLFANTIDFPQVVYGSGFTTTFVINNTGTTDVTARLNIYSQAGVLQTDVGQNLTIKAGASIRYVASGTALAIGWAEFAAPNTTVSGVATFEYRGAGGVLVTAAGVLGVEATTSFLLPVEVNATSSTGIAVANTTTNPITFRLTLNREDGTTTSTTSFQLGPHAQTSAFIDEMIPSLAGTVFKGTVVVDTPNGLIAVTAITKKEGLLSAVAVIPVNGGGTSRLSFPQAVVGGGYTTSFVIINMGTTTVNSTLRLYSQLGVELTQYSQNVSIPPGGSFRYSTPDTGPLTVAWADIDGGAGASLRGVGTYDYRSNGVLQTTVGVLGIGGSNTFTMPVDLTATGSTGIAIANLSGTIVNVTLRLLAEDGSQVAVANDTRLNPIPAHGQVAAYVEEFFTQLKGTIFKGSVVIEAASGSPALTLVATALTVKEGIFSAIPVIPTGPGGSGGSGGGGGGGTGGGPASACLDPTVYNSTTTVHYEYNVGGTLTGTEVSDITVTPNATYEGNSASEASTTITLTSAIGTIVAKGKSYAKLDGLNIVNYGGTADVTTPFGNTSTKVVYSPPCLDKRYSLAVGASDTETCFSTTTTNGTASNVSTTSTVKYLGQESVTVPAGTFNACKFQIDSADNTEWYAVGYSTVLVKSSGTSAQTGTVVLELKSGTINGTTIHP